MASKPKSRTSKSNLTKKAHVPIWAIALGLVVLVGLGALFVFKSFAAAPVMTVWCQKTDYTRCASKAWANVGGYVVPKNAYIAANPFCPMGQKEFMLTKKGSNWHCLFDGV